MQAVKNLSSFYRISLNKGKQALSIQEEVELLQSYLKIQQMRFRDSVQVEYEIAREVLPFRTIKLLLQPLVENAVKYGFTDRDKLTVKIKGYEKQGRLIFSCEDDGAGITPQQLKDIRRRLQQKENKEGHLGLYNIHRRIQLMYGEEYGIFLESEIGQGVVVVLVLPVKR